MKNAKGKGRANAADDVDEPNITARSLTDPSSFYDRVTASATGLVRSTFTTTDSKELSEHFSVALATSGKGRASDRGGNSNSAQAGSSRAVQERALEPLDQASSSFRVGQTDEHVSHTEAEFSKFLNGIDSFASSESFEPRATTGNSQTGSRSLEYSWGQSHGSVDEKQAHRRTIEEQECHDGAEVLVLLSDPHVSEETWGFNAMEDDEVDWNLTDSQLSKIRSITEELFPKSRLHQAPKAEHPLNLIPGIILESNDVGANETYTNYGEDLSRHEARRLWLDQWEGVLTRYTDEVWGNLLPLVKDARDEVGVMKQESDPILDERPKALGRLSLVLGHLHK